ncbi:hypothetical protein N9L18_00810 [Candidatus Pacebacteria bacterium]|nr:hypothetical protein [Candidatus Paceibacterota bacterium]
MAKPKIIEWQAMEHHHEVRSNDWFWIVGVIAIAGAILAAYFENILLAILIVIAGFTSLLHGHSKPKVITFKISRRGVQAGTTLYPFSSLESFWVEDEMREDKIILKSQKFMMPYIVIPYDSTKTDPEEIRDYLLEYINEEEMAEPVLQQVLENLGF